MAVTETDSRVALPDRYATPWRAPFEQAVRERLLEGATVLDIGSGRHPSIPRDGRPGGVHWIGLDSSEPELRAAPPDAYDELAVGDIVDPQPTLAGRIDLAVSWQVFEHVSRLDRALANVHRYLRDGGDLVTVFSGRWSAFAVINRVIPDRVGAALVGRSMRRASGDRPVFPAHYDQCYADALERLFAGWTSASIEPLYRGATYFHFSRPLQRAYLTYENAIAQRRAGNLATHYFVVARK